MVGTDPLGKGTGLLRILRTLKNHGRGAAPVATDGLTRLPLGHGSNPPLPRALRGILLEDAIPPGAGEPGGKRPGLQATVPGVREVRLGLDQLLADQILPVGSDLEGLRTIDGDLPGLATGGEQVPAILPYESDEPAWIPGWEVSDVGIRVGGVQFGGVVGVLRPGGGHRKIILLEDVRSVEEGHRTTILRDGVYSIAELDLIPHPGRELILHRVRPVLGDVNERAGRLELWQGLELDLTEIWLVIGLDGREQLVVFERACTDILQSDMDVGMGLVEERDLLIHPGNPGPVGQVHRAAGGRAALRTGSTTSSKRNHEHEHGSDEGKPGSKALQPWERGEKPHRLKPPLDL